MPSVLVVDDTPVDRCLVEGLLRRTPSLTVESVASAGEAIRRIEQSPPDVVVTDLLMPEINGLDLVTILRERCPGLPVVLITAHGSEDLAVRALAEGAASYVPKHQLSDRLLATIEQVLAAARADRGYETFQSCLQDARLRFLVGSHEGVFDQLTDVACGMSGSVGLCDSHDQLRLAVALRGLLLVGHYVGNLELPIDVLDELDVPSAAIHAPIEQRRASTPYRTRRLEVQIELSSARGEFRARHEGPPFPLGLFGGDAGRLPNAPNACRELILMRAFADELEVSADRRTISMVRLRRTNLGES